MKWQKTSRSVDASVVPFTGTVVFWPVGAQLTAVKRPARARTGNLRNFIFEISTSDRDYAQNKDAKEIRNDNRAPQASLCLRIMERLTMETGEERAWAVQMI